MRLCGRAVVAFACALLGCGEAPFPSSDELVTLRGLFKVRTPSQDTTNLLADDPGAAALGKRLFEDPGLSSCGFIACATCHPPPAFSGNTAKSVGCNGAETPRNAPTLLNVGFGSWHYWDGRKDSLWAHPSLPLQRPFEMAATPAGTRTYLQANYATEYTALFGRAPSAETNLDQLLVNFGRAVQAYLRTLIRMDAPFDDDLNRFIVAAEAGDASADPMFLGLKTFLRQDKGGCIACHKGPQLSDGKFHNLGVNDQGAQDRGRAGGIELVLADPYNGRSVYSADPTTGGRKLDALASEPYGVTLGAFKTPTLRNVELTAPYLHTGALNTLEEVVDFYDRGGDAQGTFLGERTQSIKPLHLSSDEKRALVQLLKSLTGRPP